VYDVETFVIVGVLTSGTPCEGHRNLQGPVTEHVDVVLQTFGMKKKSSQLTTPSPFASVTKLYDAAASGLEEHRHVVRDVV
jgi:hypothetical protein